jgi:RimJ/RimL family protein N-acetyltransferase
MAILIKTQRCFLKELNEKDDLKKYLYWMQTPSNNPFIKSSHVNYNLSQLKDFIITCNKRKDVILLGIYTNKNGLHIGNIKFDEIDLVRKSAVLGILIGDIDFRGKGIAREVILECVLWLTSKYKIETVKLGVDPNNLEALNLYQNMGFEIFEKSTSSSYVMSIKSTKLIGD